MTTTEKRLQYLKSLKFEAPAITCKSCGRESKFLFCLHCAVFSLDESGLLANAAAIMHISKSAIRRTPAKTDCIFCSQSIPADITARLIGKGIYAHLGCVSGLRERFDEVRPKPAVAEPGELPMSGSVKLD